MSTPPSEPWLWLRVVKPAWAKRASTRASKRRHSMRRNTSGPQAVGRVGGVSRVGPEGRSAEVGVAAAAGAGAGSGCGLLRRQAGCARVGAADRADGEKGKEGADEAEGPVAEEVSVGSAAAAVGRGV